jgi:serine/threonine protein kinase
LTCCQVAIKTLKDKCRDIKKLMMQPEVQALQALSHPNIVECKEFILDRKCRAHLVFELMTHGNLEKFGREQRRSLTEAEFACIARQMLSAVAYMHSRHFLHRDIKPENVLLSYKDSGPQSGAATGTQENQRPTVKLADLGLARHIKPQLSRQLTSYVATRVSVLPYGRPQND